MYTSKLAFSLGQQSHRSSISLAFEGLPYSQSVDSLSKDPMKCSRSTSAILTYFYSLSVLSYVKGSLGGLPKLHLTTYSLPEPPQQSKSITSGTGYHLEYPIPKAVARSKDTASKSTHTSANSVHKNQEGRTLCCFGSVNPRVNSQEKGSASVPKRVSREKLEKTLIIEHPAVDPSSHQLQADQMEKLKQWKSIAEVAQFMEKLELGITEIVNSLIYLEMQRFSSEDLERLLARFTENRKFVRTPATFAFLVHTFIIDVYRSRVGSNQPNLVANAYLKNEYGIYKRYARDQIFVLAKIEIMDCLDGMISKASRYYEKAKLEIDTWKEQVDSTIEMLKLIQWEMSPFHSQEIQRTLLRNQLLQTKARSGDRGLFEFLETGAQMNVSVESLQSFLLLNTKGTAPEHREKLFLHVQSIHDDLSEICDDLDSPKINHRDALRGAVG
ncbi:hypothetical protein PGTUg99_036736 [Puccinia graminis f. sp. tritici]|uniref:Uncharacterized protein n=1 Tax=Puccinia graminis f. sp. tritici TaxID=56615 RepID=A0A5B0SFM5_PUCGR|nr:hypothetical protein PGTUg99_036736 [Puccinia graminis f. sp. tritici]